MSVTARVLAGAIAMMMSGFFHGAIAQTAQQVNWCNGTDGVTTDLQIDGCTTVIESGQYIENDIAVAFYNRGNAYLRKRRPDRAIEDYSEAIKLNPNHADAWNNRCWARALAGQLDLALKDCNESVRLRPNDPNARDSRALDYLKRADFDKAIADYDTALKLDRTQSDSLHGRGLAKQKIGDRAGAEADMAAAKVIDAGVAERFAKYGVN